MNDTGPLDKKVKQAKESSIPSTQIIEIAIGIITASESLSAIFSIALKVYELCAQAELLPLSRVEEDQLRFDIISLKVDLSNEQIISIIKRLRNFDPAILKYIATYKEDEVINLEKTLRAYCSEFGIEDLIDEL